MTKFIIGKGKADAGKINNAIQTDSRLDPRTRRYIPINRIVVCNRYPS